MIRSTNILVSFESIIDTDMGLMRLIKSDYNSGFFYPTILENTEEFQHLVLNLRTHPNPLVTLMDIDNDDDLETANDLLRQFKDQEYQKILDLSPPGTFNTILSANMYSKELLKTTVVCRSQAEAGILKIKEINAEPLICKDLKEISLKNYQVIAVKDVSELDQYVNLERKAIYVPDYRFNVKRVKNFDSPLLPQHTLEDYADKNEFYVYAAYTYTTEYQGLDDEEDFGNEQRSESELIKQD